VAGPGRLYFGPCVPDTYRVETSGAIRVKILLLED